VSTADQPSEGLGNTAPEAAVAVWRTDAVDLAGYAHDEWSHSVLLARRHRYTGTLSYYRCWTPGPVPLSRLIAIAVTRWRIEEDHQLAKQSTGLDAAQVIRWKSWHRWTAICLLAYICLAVAVAVQRQQGASSDLEAGLTPITVPELLRLLRDIVIPPPRRGQAHRLHWSTWRRRHQHRARQAHQRWNA
jgi:SRSO17 transposase